MRTLISESTGHLTYNFHLKPYSVTFLQVVLLEEVVCFKTIKCLLF